MSSGFMLLGGNSGSTRSTNRYIIKSTLKIARYCPLVIQGFSNFLGLFQGIMANPVICWDLIRDLQVVGPEPMVISGVKKTHL